MFFSLLSQSFTFQICSCFKVLFLLHFSAVELLFWSRKKKQRTAALWFIIWKSITNMLLTWGCCCCFFVKFRIHILPTVYRIQFIIFLRFFISFFLGLFLSPLVLSRDMAWMKRKLKASFAETGEWDNRDEKKSCEKFEIKDRAKQRRRLNLRATGDNWKFSELCCHCWLIESIFYWDFTSAKARANNSTSTCAMILATFVVW